MTTHPTIDDLTRWRRGDLAGDELLAIGNHLATCASCAARASERFGGDAAALALCEEIELGEHPDLERDLFPFVEGRTSREQAPQIAAHLALCASCRESVDDLHTLVQIAGRRRSPRVVWLAAAAAVAAMLLLVMLFPRRTIPPSVDAPRPTVAQTPPPEPAPTAVRAAEWRSLVDTIKARGSVELPAALKALQVSPDEYRSTAAAASAPATEISPTQEIVESRRPTFTWPASEGATYVVTVVQRSRVITRSDALRANRWRCDRTLERGQAYSWQVEVSVDGDSTILPELPAPSARFAVLDADAAERLARARATAHDPLVLGILLAEAGLLKDARRELLAVDRPDDAGLARLVLTQIDQWPALR